jgi:hypothetical protein
MRTNMTELGALKAGLMAMALLGAAAASAPKAEHAAEMTARTISFGQSIRSPDRMAPTPQFTAVSPGLYTRKILHTASPAGDFTVELWSVLVSPGLTTGETRFPGAAVLSLRTGSVVVLVGEGKTPLKPGATAQVPEGALVRFTNPDEMHPAQLRAVVLAGGKP